MKGAALRVEHLTKIYPDGTTALRDVSFDVAPGQFVVIIGLSGSGKSTLMRCINRLIEPTSGKIYIDDVDVTALSQAEMRRLRRNIGMIFQQFNLVKRSSVLTNVLCGRLGYLPPAWALFNYFPADEVARALANLQRVGIPEKARTRADQLSGGQQQRVGIARALMQEPRLILADEPVASLDPATSHSVLRYVEELNKKDGITVLCAIDFLSLARRYGTRILALRAGQVASEGMSVDAAVAPEEMVPPPGGPQLLVPSRVTAVGAHLLVSGQGFRPNATGTLFWVNPIGNPQQVATFRTDAQGAFAATITVPEVFRGPESGPRGAQQRLLARVTWEAGPLRPSRTLLLVGEKIIETVFLALMGTTIAIVAAVPLSFLGAKNLTAKNPVGTTVYYLTRTFFDVMRSIEPLILAIVFTVWVGLGPFAGRQC